MKFRYEQAERIVKAVPDLVGTQKLPADERWFITSTDFYTSSWVKTTGYKIDDARYLELDENRDLLEQVLEQIES
jgi:hypothetical protein